jgi:peptidoglycan/LPS O-acetylase OafA/YrhL
MASPKGSIKAIFKLLLEDPKAAILGLPSNLRDTVPDPLRPDAETLAGALTCTDVDFRSVNVGSLFHRAAQWTAPVVVAAPPVIESCYRPDIDGLRAIAVGLVVLGHSGFFFSGGFIGVDVFFVISGFLITRLILAGSDAGTLNLKEFWLRRIRRIVPAAAVAVAATLLIGMMLLRPRELTSLAESAIAQQAFMPNIYFWAQGGYFDLPSESKPLLHTWSLAVEEQFYFIWPLILIFVFRWGKKAVALSIGMIAVVSLIGSEIMTRACPSAAFYFMPPRMWELLLGAAILFCPTIRGSLLLGYTGVALILASALAYTPHMPFPGFTALAPCVGTALIILAPATSGFSMRALLSTAPFVYVGKASYSIYLWHWPLLVFARLSLGNDFSYAAQGGVIAASLAIGCLSYEFVETPIRSRRWLADSRWLVLCAGLGAVLICASACSTVSYLTARYPEVAMTPTMPLAAKANGLIGIEPPWANCSTLGCDGPPAFVLWGDSHANAIAGLCDELARSRGLSGQCFAAAGIHPLLGVWDNQRQKREIQLEWNVRIVEWIKKKKVPNVIIVSRWEYAVPSSVHWLAQFEGMNEDVRGDLETTRMACVIQDERSPDVSLDDSHRVWQEHFRETVSALESAGTRVWFLMQVPFQPDRPRPGKIRGIPAKVYETQQYEINKVLKSCAAPMLTVIGPGKCWFDKDGLSCTGDSGGSYYMDKNHVSSYGAKKLLSPLLEPVFDQIKKNLRLRPEL